MMSSNRTTAKPTYRWLIWLILALGFTALGGKVWLQTAGCAVFFPLTNRSYATTAITAGGIGFAVIAVMLSYYRPRNRIGWLAAGVSSMSFVLDSLTNYTNCGMDGLAALPGLPYTAWLIMIFSPYYLLLQFILLPFIFPTGRFLSPRWRALAWLGSGALTLTTLMMGLLPGEMTYYPFGDIYLLENPFGLGFLPSETIGPIVFSGSAMIVIGTALTAIASMVIRWRRAWEEERQQIKWITYFLVVAVLTQIVIFEIIGGLFYPQILETVWYGLILLIVFAGFPTTIGIAVFKYRLYDIDLVIRRTIQYSLLTGLLALVFAGTVVILQGIFESLTGERDSPLVTVLSTLAIAALFNPMRTRVQEFIDRRFYRQKYDAQQALAQFAATARDEVDSDRIAGSLLGVVKMTMTPRGASLWIQKPDAKRRN